MARRRPARASSRCPRATSPSRSSTSRTSPRSRPPRSPRTATSGEVYELTGPRALRFEEVAAEISAATGREIRFTRIPVEAFTAGMLEAGVPQDEAELVTWLFTEVLDGRNARPQDGVQRALGRAPRDFGEYARTTAATGVWA